MARRLTTLLALTALVLVAAQAAAAKEGANLMTYPTAGTPAGGSWDARFEAFSHDGNALAPAVLIRNGAGKTDRFAARKLGMKAGEPVAVYRADVTFPSAGLWTYGVELRPGGATQWFDDSPVAIDPAPASPGGWLGVPLWLLVLLGAVLLGTAGSLAARRYGRGRGRLATGQI
jgi:hypothetical protein